jgi:microcystin-dependent protein
VNAEEALRMYRSFRRLVLVILVVAVTAIASPARADQFLGEIRMFAGNFAPTGWAFCEGQLLPIAQYDDLFQILGTTYGGDGVTTFALPDLRGRVALHAADGPGLPPRVLGETGGAATSETLNVIGLGRAYQPGEVAGLAGPNAHGAAAGGTTDDRMPPFLGLKFIIAIEGIFPPRP